MTLRDGATRTRAAIGSLAAALAMAPGSIACADDKVYPPIADPIVAKECGACHMRYPAGLLPAEAWKGIVEGLQNHFGENASLDAATAQHVLAYLAANAERPSGSWWRGRATPSATAPLLRITEQAWFRSEHGPRRLAPARLARRGAKSPADCAACHRQAENGNFDEH